MSDQERNEATPPQPSDRKSPIKGTGGPQAAAKPGRGPLGFLILAGLILMVFLLFQSLNSNNGQEVAWAEFESAYADGTIQIVELQSGAVVGRPADTNASSPGTIYRVTFNQAAIDTWTEKVDVLTSGQFVDKSGPSGWQQALAFAPFIFTILIFVVIWIFIMRAMRGAGGGGGMLGNFGKSRHRVLMKESTGITFKDVAGVEEAKDEVEEIARFLKDPKRFMRLGGRIPRGVLLTGPPGCGKTLLAKAIAGEADVPFFSISGSDFVEMFVGVGASRVRDLFKQARENSPCIIFLDEIDAVGRRRGGGYSSGGGHDEREQTLNAILVEMDGFESTEQIIVIASTNRPDVLDPALTRPGRFDRQIGVQLPDVKGRYEILKVHAKKVKLAADVDLQMIARGTPMFSGAELEAIINEAAIIATLADKDAVEHEDLEEARDKVRFGRANKSRVREAEDNKLTAYHEAGHTALQWLLEDADPLHKVTIIPRGQSGGATFSLPERDRQTISRKWLIATARVLCGGRIAEEKAMGDVSSGASMDIQQVTGIARSMVLEWGMSEALGFVRYEQDDDRPVIDREYSDETARVIDAEVKRIVDEAYQHATRLIDENWDKVQAIAEALLQYETLTAKEVERLMKGERLGKPSVSDLLNAEAEKVRSQDQSTTMPDPKPEADEGEAGFGGAMPSPA
ncbi:MAG: ATP-dependent zinc metalloprotease FtsH [Planctomycetota bacterium]